MEQIIVMCGYCQKEKIMPRGKYNQTALKVFYHQECNLARQKKVFRFTYPAYKKKEPVKIT